MGMAQELAVTNYCIGLPASIGRIDTGNHLLPYNLTSFAIPLFTVANGVVYVQKSECTELRIVG